MGLQAHAVTKTWQRGRVPALQRVSLDVAAGEIVGIVGPNGAGKSTLLGCLLGLVRPESGNVLIDGRSPDDIAAKKTLGYVPERLLAGSRLTAWEFLSLHHSLAARNRRHRTREVTAGLERVGMAQAGTTHLARMSRGMLQRMALAQALIGDPRNLVLDEPTSGIDPPGVALAREILRELRGQGASIVLSSHQMDQVERTCDRVLLLRAGEVAAELRPTDADTRPRLMVARFRPGLDLPLDRVDEAIEAAGARRHSIENACVRIWVAGDEGSAALLRQLVAADVGLLELTPESRRIERLFESHGVSE